MKTKNLLAIILILVMLLSALSVVASAAGEQVITPYEKIEVTASNSLNPVFKFVSEETRTYFVKSFADESIDPYCYIESEDGTVFEEFDDSVGDYNFANRFEFEAGVVYYITILTYSEEEATFEFAFECVHNWDEGTCTYCTYVCDHDTTGKQFNTCDCGAISLCKEIKLGETLTVAYEADPICVKFTPEEDVAAMFRSYVYNDGQGFDVRASLYNSNGEELEYSDDFSGSYDFLIWYEFTAGETYFFEVNSFYEEIDVVFTLEPSVHTTEDGDEHALEYKTETVGTCLEYMFYEGMYCEDCGEYIIGGKPMLCEGSHFDGDADGYCDACGEEYVEDGNDDFEDDDTDGGIFQFFYNIILYIKAFFQIIFALIM